MRRPTKAAAVGALAISATLGLAVGAVALWASNDASDPAAVALGDVSFAAQGQTGVSSALSYSADGSAVNVTLPGSELVKVLDQTGPDPAPVIWRFTATGFAQGITGLSFDVHVTSQVAKDGTVTSLSSGTGAAGTVLALSTVKVYPASVNGDCSSVPATPQDAEPRDVYVYDGDGHVLQAAGAYDSAPVSQDWCVAMAFDSDPDGTYANEVQATGTSADGTSSTAVDTWRAVVAFPPSLDPTGRYANRADVVGQAQDGTLSRSSDVFGATLYPDPSSEPDVVISLDPRVTSLHPAVTAGDHLSL